MLAVESPCVLKGGMAIMTQVRLLFYVQMVLTSTSLTSVTLVELIMSASTRTQKIILMFFYFRVLTYQTITFIFIKCEWHCLCPHQVDAVWKSIKVRHRGRVEREWLFLLFAFREYSWNVRNTVEYSLGLTLID